MASLAIDFEDLLEHGLELVSRRDRAVAAFFYEWLSERVLRKERGHVLPCVRVTQRVHAVAVALDLECRPLDRLVGRRRA